MSTMEPFCHLLRTHFNTDVIDYEHNTLTWYLHLEDYYTT